MPAAYGARSADICLNSLLVDSRSGTLLLTARLLARPAIHKKMKVTVQPVMFAQVADDLSLQYCRFTTCQGERQYALTAAESYMYEQKRSSMCRTACRRHATSDRCHDQDLRQRTCVEPRLVVATPIWSQTRCRLILNSCNTGGEKNRSPRGQACLRLHVCRAYYTSHQQRHEALASHVRQPLPSLLCTNLDVCSLQRQLATPVPQNSMQGGDETSLKFER